MYLLVIAKLSREKLISKLRPFIDNPEVKHIFILRDETFAMDCEKVSFTPVPICKGLLRHVEKVNIARKFINEHNIGIVISYLLTPHGYIAWLVTRMTGAKWIHAIIAGHREIWKNGKIMRSVNLRLLKSASAIGVMGKATYQYLENNGINEKKIAIIPNAIDGSLFGRTSHKEYKYDILYAGRIDENKNVPLLIKAIGRLSSKYPDLKVCVAGDGDKLECVKTLTDAMSLNDQIVFLGHVDHEHIKELYDVSRIFVLTSRSEGVPMALLEAMFCGMACVSTKVGEIGSIINDGVNGFLLPNTEDDKVLATKLDTLLGDNNLCHQFGNEAVKIRETYSFGHATTLWTNILKKVYNE